MASIGQTIAGPRFHETDDVRKKISLRDTEALSNRLVVRQAEGVSGQLGEPAQGACQNNRDRGTAPRRYAR
jgi:hypothetical protein